MRANAWEAIPDRFAQYVSTHLVEATHPEQFPATNANTTYYEMRESLVESWELFQNDPPPIGPLTAEQHVSICIESYTKPELDDDDLEAMGLQCEEDAHIEMSRSSKSKQKKLAVEAIEQYMALNS